VIRSFVLLDWPAEGAVEGELGGVVVGDGADVFAADLKEGLNGLEDFDGQALTALDADGIVFEGIVSEFDERAGSFDLLLAQLYLDVRLGDFAGDLIEGGQLLNLGLTETGAGTVLGGGFAVAEVTKLPEGGGVEVEAVSERAEVATAPAAEFAIAHAKEHAGNEGGETLAAQALDGFADQIAVLSELGACIEGLSDQVGTFAILGDDAQREDGRLQRLQLDAGLEAEKLGQAGGGDGEGFLGASDIHLAEAELHVHAIGVGLEALAGLHEGVGEAGDFGDFGFEVLCNGDILRGAKQLQVGEGHIEQDVVARGIGGLLAGTPALLGGEGLKDGVGQMEAGKDAGHGGRAAADGLPACSGVERSAADIDQVSAGSQVLTLVLIPVDAAAERGEPEHAGSVVLGVRLLDLLAGQSHLEVIRVGQAERGWQVDWKGGCGESDGCRFERRTGQRFRLEGRLFVADDADISR